MKAVSDPGRSRDGRCISREDSPSFLNSWLVNHIMSTDQRLGAFIRLKRAD